MRIQKIEKWRVKELALVLEQLAELLKKNKNGEWANVFLHFHTESQCLISQNTFNEDQAKKLIQSIKNCFHSTCSFKDLVWRPEVSLKNTRINHDFQYFKARLLKILDEMENSMPVASGMPAYNISGLLPLALFYQENTLDNNRA